MKAIVAESAAASGPDRAPRPLPLREIELPLPELRPHDLLVRVEAVAVNPADTKVRAGLAAGAPPRGCWAGMQPAASKPWGRRCATSSPAMR